MGGLAEFGENAEGGFGMEEGDELVSGSFEGDFVDEFGAFFFGLGELARDVVGGERDVVDAARWIFFEKLGDRAFFGSRFEKLDVDITGGEESSANFLGFDFFAALTDKAEDVFVVGDGFV